MEAALLLTGAPDATDDAVRECNEADIRNIWIYKDMHDSKDHEQAIDFSRSHGSAVMEGYCPLMFLPHPGLVHRVHRFMIEIGGELSGSDSGLLPHRPRESSFGADTHGTP